MELSIVHNLLAAVMPTPCYCVFESQGAPSSLNFSNAIGSTGKAADLNAMEYLIARGEWDGRRPCVFINDTRIAELAAAHHEVREVSRETLEQQLLAAVAVHEGGHVTEKGVDLAPPTESRRLFAEAIATYSAVTLADPDRPPFAGHEWRWLRNCCHLRYRAVEVGFDVPFDLVMSGDLYALPPLEDFSRTLDGVFELSNLQRESIFEINRFRPPHNFRWLWQQSVLAWIETQQYSPAVSAAIGMLEVTPDEENEDAT